jgi:hypothetical protein
MKVINTKALVKFFLITILSWNIIYSFDYFNPNFFRQALSDRTFYFQYYFLLIKDILLFIFLIVSLTKFYNIKFFLKIIIITFLLISILTLAKLTFYRVGDLYLVQPFKNIFLSMSLIYVSQYISFKNFISSLKIVSVISLLTFFYQIFYMYPVQSYQLVQEKLIILEQWNSGFVSGRPIGSLGSPNSLGKFTAQILIIFLAYFYNDTKKNKETVNLLKYNDNLKFIIYNFTRVSILIFIIFFSQTISVIISLIVLFLINLFLNFKKLKISSIKTITLLLSLIAASCVILFYYPEIYSLYISRLENLYNFILLLKQEDLNTFISNESFTFRKFESINPGFGTFSERADDFALLKNCIQAGLFKIFLIGCNYRFDSVNIGVLNVILNFGLFISILIIYFLSVLLRTKLQNQLDPQQKIIDAIMKNIIIFFIVISFPSKIFEISVVNYIFFIMLGYYLNEFKIKNTKCVLF